MAVADVADSGCGSYVLGEDFSVQVGDDDFVAYGSAYVQVPGMMSAPGPFLKNVYAPTVDWMQYVVAVGAVAPNVMFLMPPTGLAPWTMTVVGPALFVESDEPPLPMTR